MKFSLMVMFTMSSKWKFEWLTSWNEVLSPSFIAQWQSWMDQSTDAHVFFEPSIVRAWVETYKDIWRIEPRFLIARSGDDITVFFPLVYVRGGWKDARQRSIVAVGYSDFDYNDPVVVYSNNLTDVETFWAQFEKNLYRHWSSSCDAILINGLRSFSLPKGHEYHQIDSAPWIDLSLLNSFDDFLSKTSKKLCQNIRYQERRLKKEGNLELRQFSPGETEAAKEALKDFLKMRAEKWPEAYIVPGLFRRIIDNALPNGLLHFSELQHNSKSISWVFGFIHKERFYYYIPVFRPDMANYSPGKVHLAMLIDYAIYNGIKIFDLLKGAEPYKTQWAENTTPIYIYEWTGRGLRAKTIRVWQKQVRPILVKSKKKLFNVKQIIMGNNTYVSERGTSIGKIEFPKRFCKSNKSNNNRGSFKTK